MRLLRAVTSVLTPLPLRGLTGPARRLPVLRAQIHPKPPREQLRTMDITIGLTSCFLCFLLPSGWVLSHPETYKKRERQELSSPSPCDLTTPACPDHVCCIPGWPPGIMSFSYSDLFCNHDLFISPC
ncbi:cytochrome c oxidase subunit 8A, mitochondrial-like [Balaenoptera acutorostrata]|uniref:Cytochrome c oxidase subunit 8 n=1 Tax=Balaenoptera acutorostrata TaxID=9767 RepID=A0ABM3S4G0_BALAC|nr:cytochrome c oxidase subunit 8A, mitochondrial-like [Balaenoptera acutorostrata]